jgi:hypothetical protein
VSSRHEIVILPRSDLYKSHFGQVVLTHDNGAHGVVAVNAIQEFVAPIGAGGLVCLTTRRKSRPRVRIERTPERSLNFYKVTVVREYEPRALLAAACRKGGIAAFCLTQGQPPSAITRHVFGKGDIVDIVAVGEPQASHGVIGLSKDGSLVWIPDVLASAPPRTISPRISIDTAYSLLLVKGHGLVLADKTLSCLPYLVDGLVSGRDSIDGFTIPFEGDELLPAAEGSFFLLTDEGPREFEIEQFIQDANALHNADARGQVPPEPYSAIIRANVSQYGYLPAELDWNREPDAAFDKEFVG